MSEPNHRPRPQYGEYATPEEQRAHIREPLPTTSHPDPAEFSWPDAPPAPAGVQQAPARDAVVAPGDRLATILLLAMGGAHVLMTAIGMLSYASAMIDVLMAFGLTREQADVPRSSLPGYLMAAALVVGFAVTVWLSLRRLRAQKRSWWVPLAGWAVTWAVVIVIQSVALMGDPSFLAYLDLVQSNVETPTP